MHLVDIAAVNPSAEQTSGQGSVVREAQWSKRLGAPWQKLGGNASGPIGSTGSQRWRNATSIAGGDPEDARVGVLAIPAVDGNATFGLSHRLRTAATERPRVARRWMGRAPMAGAARRRVGRA
jgi:hypothetical protein